MALTARTIGIWLLFSAASGLLLGVEFPARSVDWRLAFTVGSVYFVGFVLIEAARDRLTVFD
ncbi:hypothetical protein [Haloarcula salinisoli]|uniref:Uncharacterized protein n=1 Tax=Haloarcula salinisoli TaxID=2487746 RepID=A0A8J8CCT8_9EURY|nr:hypothetical protein [Halomicroarcula salinisoli]MBX0286545.1 hypothetical protein [Halomicroarcula salinisoli]MBX0303895.1 hypothetical protein [Halomicroarcula salinisoli]